MSIREIEADEIEYEDVTSEGEYTDASDSELGESHSHSYAQVSNGGGFLAWLHSLPLLSSLRLPTDMMGWSGISRRISEFTLVAGNLAWVFTTSMLLIGLPVLFAYDREKALQEQQLLSLASPAVPK